MATNEPPATTINRSWMIAQRWQAYDAEIRANYLRIAAIGLFYSVHLWTYISSTQVEQPRDGLWQLADIGVVIRNFHLLVTLIAVAWAMLALGILVALQQQIFPRWLPYFSTASDLTLLTAIICLGTAARSPLVSGYFLILALATLRLQLPLVWFGTAGAAAAYVCVLGFSKWPDRFGLTKLLADSETDLTVPRYQQIIVLLSIVLMGIVLGQIVRRVNRLMQEPICFAPMVGGSRNESRVSP